MWPHWVPFEMARKNVAFKIRLTEELRRAFADACRAAHRPAAQVVRELMRGYISGIRADSERSLTRATAETKPLGRGGSGE